jgi:hypothetical protein
LLGFDVALSPRWWSGVGAIRQFVGAFLAPIVRERALADRVALSAHELLENALKYCTSPDGRVHCKATMQPGRITLCVRNRASTARIERLRSEFDLVTAGDPLETYLAMMQRSLEDDQASQLGLARIRYEAGAELSLEIERDWVSVAASFATPEMIGA